MNNSEDTTEQIPERSEILKAIADLGKSLNQRIDVLERNTNIQFEAIRSGIVANSAAFDRLQAKVLNLSADVKELTEEIHQMKKESVM